MKEELDVLKSFITEENNRLSEKLEHKIDKQLASLKYWGIGGMTVFCVVFSWIFDYKFDFTNNQHQAKYERLESVVFISKHDAILNAIQDLKYQISDAKNTKEQISKKKSKRK